MDDLDQELADPLQEPTGGGQELLGGGGERAVGGGGREGTGRFYLRPGWTSYVSLQTNTEVMYFVRFKFTGKQ